jgi:hypothetical protein
VIYIIDNGQPFSMHEIYFVEAASTFENWFDTILTPWRDANHYSKQTIIAVAPDFSWRDKSQYMSVTDFLNLSYPYSDRSNGDAPVFPGEHLS